MNPNQKGVLMCYNIPKGIKEECLYELFCAAGPVETIQPGKSGRSLFVIYEFGEAVATAKEILKDVKLYGRPIRMFDKEDIESIHAKQEEQLNSGQHEMNYGRHMPPGPPQYRRYEDYPGHSHSNQNYHASGSSRYQDNYSRESNHQNYSQYHAESYRSQDVYSRNNDHHRGSKSTSVYSDRPQNDREQGVPNNDDNYLHNRMQNDSHDRGEDARDNFRNPYEEQVSRYNSRNSHRYQDYRHKKRDRPYDRPNQRDHYESRPHHSSHSSKNSYRNRQRY